MAGVTGLEPTNNPPSYSKRISGEKKDLISEINSGLRTSELSLKFNCSQTNIQYYLKKYRLKTNYKKYNSKSHNDYRVCPSYKEKKHRSLFYNRRRVKGSSPYCKVCTNLQTVKRTRDLKSKAVDYKGGACMKCGYDRFIGALEFHHLDPDEKDFNISSKKSISLESIILELDKCILLCSNCHKEAHGVINGNF